MSQVELLHETFEPPADKHALVSRNRETIIVNVVVPQGPRTYESFAQQIEEVRSDDESRELRVTLQQPFENRLGMFLLRGGPDAFVVDIESAPADVDTAALPDAGRRLAAKLLEHHGF